MTIFWWLSLLSPPTIAMLTKRGHCSRRNDGQRHVTDDVLWQRPGLPGGKFHVEHLHLEASIMDTLW